MFMPCRELKYDQFPHIICLNLVATATPFAPLKIPTAYFTFLQTPKTLLFTRKILNFLHKTEPHRWGTALMWRWGLWAPEDPADSAFYRAAWNATRS